MRLLLVEDNLELADGLVNSLAQSSYVTDAVHSGHAALIACATMSYQLVILDLGLPDIDGIELLRQLRQRGLISPVLILTARDDLQDRIHGLDAGGDDYLSKPFELGELEARIRALLRRGSVQNVMLRFSAITFDPLARQATIHGEAVNLTGRELAVLELLLQRPGRIVSKQQLLESMYSDADDTNLTVIEVFVSRLRRKLEAAGAEVGIRSLRGLGYRLEQAAHE
jgi:DNA-binding response OmpR family regulator